MEKIPSLIHDGQIDPQYEWVWGATPTQQFDGLPYAIIHGAPYAHLSSRTLPVSMVLCNTSAGLFHGWVPVPQDDERFWAVWEAYDGYMDMDWSYELIGPSVLGNPEHGTENVLRPHGTLHLRGVEPTVESITAYLASHPIEGIVWWEDPWEQSCRKVKVQQADFGLKRRSK